MAQSQSWSSRNTSGTSIRFSEEEALRARAEQEKQLRDLERRDKIEGLKDYKEKFKQVKKYVAEDIRDNFGSAIGDVAVGLHSALSKQLDSTINSYVENYQTMMASLVGSKNDWEKITDNLNNALSASSLIKQQDVYKNLTELVKAGISGNVEQRAFLETLSNDLNLLLDTHTGSLARLIRQQNTSIAENRLAIQYSLREFLNENYATSEYIKNAYTKVAESITELQAINTTSDAASMESVLQTWLGSYYSAGVSDTTISNLASAINALGTGDISNINSNISKLVMMGAARSNESYGNLLTNGLTADSISSIMSGITSYAKEITGNNVVRSQWANIFGLTLSDLEALKKVGFAEGASSVSSNINKIFENYSNLVPKSVGLKNIFENAMFTTGTNIASNDALYATYLVTDILEKSGIGNMIEAYGRKVASDGLRKTGAAISFAGTAINYSKLIPYLGGLLSTAVGDNFFGNFAHAGSLASTYSLLGETAGASAGSSVTMTPKVSTSIGDINKQQITEAAGDETSTDEYIRATSETAESIFNALAGDVGNSIKDILVDIRNNMTSGSTGIGMQSSWAYTQI